MSLTQVKQKVETIRHASEIPAHKKNDAEFLRGSLCVCLNYADAALASIEEVEKTETGDDLVEGMYQKMWKDFVSLQRGDATLISKDAERYRYLLEHMADTEGVLYEFIHNFPNIPPTKEELDAGIDSAIEELNGRINNTMKGS